MSVDPRRFQALDSLSIHPGIRVPGGHVDRLDSGPDDFLHARRSSSCVTARFEVQEKIGSAGALTSVA